MGGGFCVEVPEAGIGVARSRCEEIPRWGESGAEDWGCMSWKRINVQYLCWGYIRSADQWVLDLNWVDVIAQFLKMSSERFILGSTVQLNLA